MKNAWTMALAAIVILAVPKANAGEVEREMELPPGTKVEVRAKSGEIKVETWDKQTLWFRATSGGDNVTDRVEDGVAHISAQGDAELLVRVPFGLDVSVEGFSADVSVSRSEGNLEIETASGEIKCDFTGARLMVRSISGDVHLTATATQAEINTGSGEIKGMVNARSLRAETVSGDILIGGTQEKAAFSTASGDIKQHGSVGQISVGSVSGDIEVQQVTVSAELFTSGGDIKATGYQLADLRAESIGGDINFHGTLAEACTIDVSTKGGDVLLGLPPETPARYELRSFSGDIESAGTSSSGNGPGKHVEFSTAAASAQVTAKSFSGDIKVESYSSPE